MDFFNISKTDEDSFVFCGMKISQSSDKSITVSQLDYASNIEEIPDYTHMTDPEKLTLLKSIAGQIMYLSLTRPDLVFEASDLLRSGRTNDERLLLAKQLMKKVKDGEIDKMKTSLELGRFQHYDEFLYAQKGDKYL